MTLHKLLLILLPLLATEHVVGALPFCCRRKNEKFKVIEWYQPKGSTDVYTLTFKSKPEPHIFSPNASRFFEICYSRTDAIKETGKYCSTCKSYNYQSPFDASPSCGWHLHPLNETTKDKIEEIGERLNQAEPEEYIRISGPVYKDSTDEHLHALASFFKRS